MRGVMFLHNPSHKYYSPPLPASPEPREGGWGVLGTAHSAVATRFAFVRRIPEIPLIMKRRFCHRVRVIAILFGFAIAIGPTPFTMAAGSNGARVTQAIHNVQLLAPKAAPRAASVNGNIPPGTAVRTGSDSRAELTFTNRTLARLGANSVFSFGDREFDLASDSMLLYAPKNSGGARINTAVATIAGNSFTAMAEYHSKSWLKFIILEGCGGVSLKHHSGETRTLQAGKMIWCARMRRSCHSRSRSIFPK